MGLIDSLIVDALNGQLAQKFAESWQTAIFKRLASAAVRHLDVANCAILPSWDQLDDPILRYKLIEEEGDIDELCIEYLCNEDNQRIINESIENNGLGKLSKPKLKTKLQTIVPDLLRRVHFASTFVDKPFPKAWRFVSDELAIKLYESEDGNNNIPEWKLLNHLQMIGYFQDCRLSRARSIRDNFLIMEKPILGLRGSLLRIPERISKDCVIDKELGLTHAQTLKNINLQHTNWSELQNHIQLEILQMDQNKGVLHQVLNVHAPSILAQRFGVPQYQIEQTRDSDYTQVEYAILSYLTLSAIEQLLRGWASHAGIVHINSSKPLSWSRWIDNLPLTSDTIAAVRKLYETDEINLRNRIMHGGLLPLTSKLSEVIMFEAKRMGYPVSDVDLVNDPMSTRNIALTCLDCLVRIDQEVSNQNITLGPLDRSWESKLALTDFEILFGHSAACEICRRNTVLEYRKFMRYMYGVFPAFADCFSIGLHGSVQSVISNHALIQHMCLGLVFEGIYRGTAHLLGIPTIRKSWELNANQKILHSEYRLLDGSRPEALCGEITMQRLLGHLGEAERVAAKTVLLLAVKARNALAHGAVFSYSENRLKGERRIFTRSMEILKDAGIHHMVKEGAYYRWLGHLPDEPFSHEENWIEAEREIDRLVEKKLPPL